MARSGLHAMRSAADAWIAKAEAELEKADSDAKRAMWADISTAMTDARKHIHRAASAWDAAHDLEAVMRLS